MSDEEERAEMFHLAGEHMGGKFFTQNVPSLCLGTEFTR